MGDWYEEIVPKDKNFTLVDTPKKFGMMTRVLEDKKVVGTDLETTGLNSRKDLIVGMSFAYSFKDAFYIPMSKGTGDPYWNENSSILKWIKKYLDNDQVGFVLHNGKFDRKFMRREGFDIRNFAFDTMLADYLINENFAHKLEICGRRMLPDDHSRAHDKISELVKQLGISKGTALGMLRVPMKLMKNYACLDTTSSFELSQLYNPILEKENLGRLYYMLMMPLQEVLMEMEERGVRIDTERLRKLKEVEPDYIKFSEEIFEMVGERLNLNSPDQVCELLYDKLRLTRQNNKEGNPSSDDGALSKLSGEHPVVDLIRKYRSSFKIYTSYIVGLSELLDGDRLYTSFLAHGTRTGRLSSADPNLQNIPVRSDLGKKIRACFVPDIGSKFGDYDFSQIELRALAYYSRDPILLKAYQTNEDIHRKTASIAFGVNLENVTDRQRGAGKTLNFGVIYGMSAYGLKDALKGHWREGIDEVVQAQQFLDKYFGDYRGVKSLIDRTHKELDRTGEVISMFGRRRRFPNINSVKGFKKGFLQRQAFNALVQGTASDITSLALIRVNNLLKERGFNARPVIDVHDELIFNVPNEECEELGRLIPECMIQKVGDFDVPLGVDGHFSEHWEK
jgi:DNA polymerase-1